MDAAALCVRFHGEFCLSEAAYAITEKRKDGSFQKAFARTEDMRHARLGLRWKRARMKDVNEHLKDDYVKRGVRSCFPGRRKERWDGRARRQPVVLGERSSGRSSLKHAIEPSDMCGGRGAILSSKNPVFQSKNGGIAGFAPENSKGFRENWQERQRRERLLPPAQKTK